MGVINRLRHINGNNLYELESFLEKRVPTAHVVSVNKMVNGEWYIHFILPSDIYFAALNDPDETKRLKDLEDTKDKLVETNKPKTKIIRRDKNDS